MTVLRESVIVQNSAEQARGTVDGAPRADASASYRSYPYVTLATALGLLRIGTAALFMAHATVRAITPGSIERFGGFLQTTGIPRGTAVVYAITVFEVTGGLLMMLGIATRYLAAGFGAILVVGIALIHRHQGWFVGEHGTGGSEYSVALLLALLVIAAADANKADGARVLPH